MSLSGLDLSQIHIFGSASHPELIQSSSQRHVFSLDVFVVLNRTSSPEQICSGNIAYEFPIL